MSKLGPGFRTAPGITALVTGSSGMCGARLVELLLERGAKHVICMDISAPDVILERFEVAKSKTGGNVTILSGKDGDITSDTACSAAFQKYGQLDIVFHLAALVGPFYDRSKYHLVNHIATKRLIQICQVTGVTKFVYSSSPSTRFTGADVDGLTEDQLPMPTKWLAMYAEAKAYGEMAVQAACSDSTTDPTKPYFLTVSVAPHQVYGPHDALFLPNLLETAGHGRLRVFGNGRNRISVTYCDNYAHGLLCGADALAPGAPCLGQLYICTDGPPVYLWEFINQAVVAMGFTDLTTKWHLPVWLLYTLAYAANVLGFVLKRKFKLNPFNVKMLIIHRYFSIERAQRDLQYEPLVSTEKAWASTIEWFHKHWLPGYALKGPRGSSKKRD